MNPEISQRLRQRLEQEYGDIPDKTFEAYVRELWDMPLEGIARAFSLVKKHYKDLPAPAQFKALCSSKPKKHYNRSIGLEHIRKAKQEILK